MLCLFNFILNVISKSCVFIGVNAKLVCCVKQFCFIFCVFVLVVLVCVSFGGGVCSENLWSKAWGVV